MATSTSTPRSTPRSRSNGGSFYSRSGQKSTGATPTRAVRSGESGHRTRPVEKVQTYGPGQDLFDLPEWRDGSSASSDSASDDAGNRSIPSDIHTPTSFATPLSRPRVHRSTRKDDLTNLFTLLQQQQATLKHHGELLQDNLRHQQLQSVELDKFEEKLVMFEEKFDDMEAFHLNAPPRRKIKVTRDITKKVNMVHEELEAKFEADECFGTAHNTSVTEKLIAEVLAQSDPGIDKATIKTAVKRCYENKRRQALESKKENCYREQLHRSRKYRSRRQRKFDNRTQVIMDKEKRFWEKVSVAYMTEESDDSSNPTQLITHKLPWRSQKFDSWMEALDRRYLAKQRADGAMFPKKNRVEGSPSESAVPFGVPVWVLDKEWSKQHASLDPGNGSNGNGGELSFEGNDHE